MLVKIVGTVALSFLIPRYNTSMSPEATPSLFHDPRSPTDPLAMFLLQVILVLIFTRLLGSVLKYVHQPSVIGEILGGIILGPSVLGQIPGWSDTFFPKWSLPSFALVANLGLIFFMFFVGMEVDMGQMKQGLRAAGPISIAAIVFPFLTGCVASLWLYDVNGNDVSRTSFILFFGTAMSFTAFPVLASILHNFKLLKHHVGILAFAAAAVDDVAAWCVLAIASAFVSSNSPVMGVYTTLIAILYGGLMLLAVGPLLRVLHKRMYLVKRGHKAAALTETAETETETETTVVVDTAATATATASSVSGASSVHGAVVVEDEHYDLNRNYVSIIFIMLLISSFISESIGIHAFFGAYIAGVIVPKEGGFVEQLAPKIELVVVDFLLPLFFVTNGLKLELQAISGWYDFGVMVSIIVIASFGKMFPTLIATKISTGQSWRFALSMATLMNTRGLVELIVLNVGLNLGILTPKLFAMMVVMAIVTTAMTPPIIWALFNTGGGVPLVGEKVEREVTIDPVIAQKMQAMGLSHDEKTYKTITFRSVNLRTTDRVNAAASDDDTYSGAIHEGNVSVLHSIFHSPLPIMETIESVGALGEGDASRPTAAV